MKLYNKGQRSFIIHKHEAISGCRIPEDILGQEKAYIEPGTEVEVEDQRGEKLLKDYPTYFKRMSSEPAKKIVRLKKKTESIKVEKKATKKKR